MVSAPGPPIGIEREQQQRKTFDISNFDINAVLRGAQLTLVGAHRALQNPDLFTSKHYKQAVFAVLAGVAIRAIIAVPIIGIRVLLWSLSLFYSLDSVTWDDSIINGLTFVEDHVLQAPLFLMTLMRYLTPTLDDMFMNSLQWVDVTYVQKHKNDDPDKLRDMYYPNLRQYPKKDGSTHSTSSAEAISMFAYRFARKGLVSLAVVGASFLPFVGRFILPVASFHTFNRAVGLGPACIIFGTGIFLPRRCLVIFLQTYFSSKSLMRELLEPYFARVHMTKQQKKSWFQSREGLLFGFGIGFYTLLRVPLLGVLVYGIAESSTAYLITKITDPPPPPVDGPAYIETQLEWRNKQKFLSLPLEKLDTILDKPPPYSQADPHPPTDSSGNQAKFAQLFMTCFPKGEDGEMLSPHGTDFVFPAPRLYVWDFEGTYCTSPHVPGVRSAGLIHPGILGCAPSADGHVRLRHLAGPGRCAEERPGRLCFRDGCDRGQGHAKGEEQRVWLRRWHDV